MDSNHHTLSPGRLAGLRGVAPLVEAQCMNEFSLAKRYRRPPTGIIYCVLQEFVILEDYLLDAVAEHVEKNEDAQPSPGDGVCTS